MIYLLIKKNSLRMIRIINMQDASCIRDFIAFDDMQVYEDYDIDYTAIGFEYQHNGLYLRICATQEEAEAS